MYDIAFQIFMTLCFLSGFLTASLYLLDVILRKLGLTKKITQGYWSYLQSKKPPQTQPEKAGE